MEKNEFGEKRGVVKPFIIDLESTNGTHVNDEQIPSARYYELKLNDGEFDFYGCGCEVLIMTSSSYQIWHLEQGVCVASRECCGVRVDMINEDSMAST